MTDVSLKTKICGVSYLDLTFLEHHYKNFKFYFTLNLIADSIIGDDLLQQHKSVTSRKEKKNFTFQQLCRLPCTIS